MIEPEEFDRIAERIVGGAEERFVTELSEQLVASLISGGELSVKDMRTLEALAQANHKALEDILLTYRSQIAAEASDAVTQALADSDANDVDMLSSVYPNVAPAGATALFSTLSAQTATGVASIISRQNIALTESAERLWYEVAGEAVAAWNHGVKTPDEILTEAVSKLSKAGISYIDYKSGVRTAVDAATRRHIVSQIGQASGRMTMARLDEYGHELVRVSAHFGARPEHEIWQGKAYCLKGRKLIDGVVYQDFYRATEYGSVTGLLGVNCRHSFGPYYPGITELPQQIPAMHNGLTSEEYYDAVQKQRRYEAGIRKTKREITLANKVGVSDVELRLGLGRQQRALAAHVKDKKLVRNPKREKAYGIGTQPRALNKTPIKMKASFLDETSHVKNIVNSTRSKALVAEPEITIALKKLEGRVVLQGLDYKVKTTESLWRKVRSDAYNKSISITKSASEIHDVLRYTYVAETEHLTDGFFEIKRVLENSGYSFTKIKNTIAARGVAYRGINTTVAAPSGYRFEIQFHTRESFGAKDKQTHAIYEKIRTSRDVQEIERLTKEMVAISDAIPTPPGAERIR